MLIMDKPQNVHLNLGKGFEFSIAQNVGAGSYNGMVEIALIDNRNDTWEFVPIGLWLIKHATRNDWAMDEDTMAFINADKLAHALKQATKYVEQIDG